MGRSPCCSKEGMNRGAWTSEEDQLLTRYIQSHGVGKWRNLPKKAGLNRCGKSCRLRWLNYLRPDIKRGNISPYEEDLIIRLHKLLGNRWSLIAGRLPGRTDNEIKNYWNTNLGKRVNRFPIAAAASSPTTKPRTRKLICRSRSDVAQAQVVVKTEARNLGDKKINNDKKSPGTQLETSSSNVDGSSHRETHNSLQGSVLVDFGVGAEISLSELLLGCKDDFRDFCDFNTIIDNKGQELLLIEGGHEMLISSEEMLDEVTWNIDVIDQVDGT